MTTTTDVTKPTGGERHTIIDLKGQLTKVEALKAIKVLRDHVNDTVDVDWTNEVCFHLDGAADAIEFPNSGSFPIKRSV